MSTRRLPLAAEEPSRPIASAAPLGATAAAIAKDGAKEGDLLQVGDLAKATGKTVRAIHLYEELGLLRAHERSKGRYRLFTSDALIRVRWISKLQNLGLSLSEIQELVREQDGSDSATIAAQKLKEVYVARLGETRRKLEELRELEAELEQSLAYLSACDSACESQLPVHSCPSCERHPEREHAPELVAAVHVV
ncbi:MAG TPA: MerR family transcriptional regulator [Polyangiaceae bacterium]|jgi:MerR family copper efflux transcriptional regulator|nr:MerR family transcriptional regulator [Polyangiaceae bacterium]